MEPAATTLTLKPGGSATVSITVNPENGFAAEVTLSSVVVESAAKLSSSYAPNPTQVSSTLTLSADAVSAPGTYTVLVKGEANVNGANVTNTTSLEVTVQAPTTITVTGRVVNSAGQPVAGALVAHRGVTLKLVDTDANGGFTFTNIAKPYSLLVGIDTQTHVFAGLTRADPTLPLLDLASVGTALTGSSTVSGTLSGGGGFPNPASTISQVVFAASDAQTLYANPAKNAATLPPAAGGGYNLNAQWTGANSVSGTLYALQWLTDPASLTRPTVYKGFGSRAVTLNNTTAKSAQNIALSPVGTGNLNLAVNASSGTTVTGRGVYVNLDARSFFVLVNELTPDTNATYAVPQIPGKNLSVAVSAKHSSGGFAFLQKNGLQPGAAVTLTVPTPPLLVSPAPDATNLSVIPSLVYTPTPNAVNVLIISDGSKKTYYYNAGLSLKLSSAKKYSWAVVAIEGYTSTDAFTGADWTIGYPSFGDDRSFLRLGSSVRSFTTK